MVSSAIGETQLEARQPASDGEACSSHAPFTRGHRNLPDNAIALCRQEDRRRTGHEWELVIPVTSLEAVRSSSLNTARQTWNHLPEDIVEILDPVRFKNAVKSPAVYDCLACKGIIRRTELAI
jgi:hypothetical protein